jgi:hypothetical protein
VAAAITASKLVTINPESVVAEAQQILAGKEPSYIPTGSFWLNAYHPTVLGGLCQFREAFLDDCSMPARIALRGIVLGALHGPKQKSFPSYFSNQCPRTYAPKPAYALRFWRERELNPEQVDVLAIIERRAKHYYNALPEAAGFVRLADSRHPESLLPIMPDSHFNWIITSPPYYGMRTYIPDQWLRNWFLGGPDSVDYSNRDQVVHRSPEDFVADLRQTWCNAARVSAEEAQMVVRFGGIADRHANPLDLIEDSLSESGWSITAIREAGSATEGRRQADAFLRSKTKPMLEHDVWAGRNGSQRHKGTRCQPLTLQRHTI